MFPKPHPPGRALHLQVDTTNFALIEYNPTFDYELEFYIKGCNTV